MQNTYTWRVIPTSEPTVIRNCPKCGSQSEYKSTGNFRINANSHHIDVWLIYQCSKCKSTWNMEIFSRVNPTTIDKELYSGFLKNDPALARQYAFDLAAHSRNKSRLNYEGIDYQVQSFDYNPSGFYASFQVEIFSEYPLDIRLDQLISRQLGISREQIKKLSSLGNISCEGIKDIRKAKLRNGMLIRLSL